MLRKFAHHGMQLTFFQLFLSRSLRFAAYITRGEFKSISAKFLEQ